MTGDWDRRMVALEQAVRVAIAATPAHAPIDVNEVLNTAERFDLFIETGVWYPERDLEVGQ